MKMFSFIQKKSIIEVEKEQLLSSIYRFRDITEEVNIDKKVWIKYYRNEQQEMGIMPINGAIKFKGGLNVMIYIEKEKGEYGIYDYSGVLMVSRKTDGNSRADELLNLDEIIAAIKKELIRL